MKGEPKCLKERLKSLWTLIDMPTQEGMPVEYSDRYAYIRGFIKDFEEARRGGRKV